MVKIQVIKSKYNPDNTYIEALSLIQPLQENKFTEALLRPPSIKKPVHLR